MKIFKKITNLLNQPFPEDNTLLAEFKSALAIGFFIFLFLFLFKPFGLHRTGDKLFIFAIMFGLITTGVSIMYDLLLDYVFRIDRQSETWTFGKWLISVTVLVGLIASANYLLLYFILNAVSLSLSNFISVLYSTLLIGIFPIIFIGAISMSQSRKRNEALAGAFKVSNIKTSGKILEIVAEDGDRLELNETDFLYAEAMQNYVAIFERNGSGLMKHILRMPLKDLEKQIAGKSILRCHRSYIVNTDTIKEMTGNAQGLKLFLISGENAVPVSRSYVKNFR